MKKQRFSGDGERGSAAGVVALLLLAAVLALAAYVAFGLLNTPQVVQVSPNPVAEKSAVVIQGSRFAPSAGGNIVLFGDQTGKVLRAGPTELQVEVPDLGLPEGRQARVPVRVLVEGRVSESVELTIGLPAPPGPRPTPIPEPTSSPEEAPSPEATPTPPSAASAAPRPRPPAEPKPKPTPTATPGAGTLVSEAEAALASGDYARATQLFGQALELEPASEEAKAGLESAKAAIASLARTFVLGRTQVEGVAARTDMKAFDTRDVSVRKPPEVPGRLEIAVSPGRVKPGDEVHFKVWLHNDGGKAIKLQALNVATTAGTVRTSGPLTPAVKEVAAGRRALLAEISETWKPSAGVYRLEVQVTSDRGETYSNVLSWK